MTRCPPTAELTRFLDGQAGTAFEGIEAHVEGCPDCQRALDGLTRAADTAWHLPGVEVPARPAGPRPPRVPGYVVCGPGRAGGHGVVFRAVDRALERPVALKVLRDGPLATPAARARLATEARAVGRLDHPHVVRVYGLAAAADGTPVVVMEWVPGGSLADRLDGAPIPPKTAAALVRAVADGAACAHAAGVLHRDIKPANVLLPDLDLSAPKLGDFGLAKLLDAADGPTPTAAVLGTPAYLAPEVAAGGADRATPAADVWALGAVLYECLTGRPPFAAATPFETAALAKSADPVPPRRLAPAVPRDLETVCLKCLEKDPRRRYPTARELADDLGRVLAGRPVLARPPGPVNRAVKWGRRNPVVAGLAGLTAAVVLASLVTTTVLWRRAEAHRADAEDRERLAGRRNEQAREAVRLYATLAKRVTAATDMSGPEWADLERAVGLTVGVLEEAGGDPDEERKSAYAVLQLADVFRLAGRLDRAEELTRRATAVLGRLAAGGDRRARSAYVDGCLQHSALLATLGRADEAGERQAEGVRVAEGLAGEYPENDHYRTILAGALAVSAGDRLARGDPAGALGLLDRSVPIQRALLEKHPTDPDRYRVAGSAMLVRAQAAVRAGRPPGECAARVGEMADLGCRALAEYPGHSLRAHHLLGSLPTLVHALDHLGQTAAADAVVARVRAAWEAHARDHPADAVSAAAAAAWLEVDGWRRPDAGDRFRQAAAAARRAHGLAPIPDYAANLARLLATCPDPAVRRPNEAVALARDLAGAHRWVLGAALYEGAKPAEAREVLEGCPPAADPSGRLYLVLARRRCGQPDSARELLREVEAAVKGDPFLAPATRALLDRARREVDGR